MLPLKPTVRDVAAVLADSPAHESCTVTDALIDGAGGVLICSCSARFTYTRKDCKNFGVSLDDMRKLLWSVDREQWKKARP